MKFLKVAILSFCLPLFLLADDAFEVTVLGDRVNLRNAASVESDVVGQANYGQKLQAVAFDESWVQVKAPDALATWVYAPLLFEDKEVRAPELNIRSGPGTQFIVLGELKRGDKIEVLEQMEDWRKITPPDAVSLWISRDFVKIPDAVLTAKVKIPEPTPTATPVPQPTPIPTPVTVVEIKTVEKIVEVQVTPTPLPKVEAPEGLDLVPLKGQGTLSKRKGIVRAYLLAGSSPSRFVLVSADDRDRTICYLIGEEEMLKSVSGRSVTVSGHDFWITGKKLPVTKVDSIRTLQESP